MHVSVCRSVCPLVGGLVYPSIRNLFFWQAGTKTAIDLGVYTALILLKKRKTAVIDNVLAVFVNLLYPSLS